MKPTFFNVPLGRKCIYRKQVLSKELQMTLRCLFTVTSLCMAGCFKAPVELQQAMRRQAQEIQTVKSAYGTNIVQLLNALETLQLEYLREAENRIRNKYLHEGKIGQRPGPGADEDLLIIRVTTERKIDDYFAGRQTIPRQCCPSGKAS